jgi:hypothetical protein
MTIKCKYKRIYNIKNMNNNGINIIKNKEFNLASMNKKYNNKKKNSIKRYNLKMNWNDKNMSIN